MSWVAVAIGGSAVLGYAASDNAANKQASGANQASQTQLGMFNQTQGNLSPWLNSGNMSLATLSKGLGLGVPQSAMAPQVDWNAYLRNNPDVAAVYGNNPQYHYSQWGQKEGRPISYLPGRDESSFPIESGSLTKPFSLSDFQASPAYNFNLEQGQMAIDKAAAARHNFYAPSTLQQIAKYSQGLASNEFQNAYNNYNQNMKNTWDRLYALSGSGQNAGAQLGGFGTTVGGQVGENQIGAANAQAAGQIGQANAISGGVGSYYNTNMLSQYLANQQAPTYPSGTKSSGQVAPDFMNS